MVTFVKTSDGAIHIVWSDNVQEKTMDVYPLGLLGIFDCTCNTTKELCYSEIVETAADITELV